MVKQTDLPERYPGLLSVIGDAIQSNLIDPASVFGRMVVEGLLGGTISKPPEASAEIRIPSMPGQFDPYGGVIADYNKRGVPVYNFPTNAAGDIMLPAGQPFGPTSSRPVEGLPSSPAEATIKGLEVGDEKSGQVNQRNFFDKLFSKETAMGLLDIFAQPEFIQAQRGLGGVSPLAAFSLAAAGKRQREAAAMAKEQEAATKLQLEAIKKSGAGRELLAKPEVQRLITQSRSTFNMIKDVGKLTKIFGEGKTSGAVPILKDSLVNLANIFGFNLDQTSKQTAKSIIAAIKAEQAAARTFGRELSQRDYDILERVLAEPDLLSSDAALRASYFRFLKKVQGAHQQTVRSLNMIVGPEISRGILSPSQYQGSLVRSVEQGN
jgi:hypothetical protein